MRGSARRNASLAAAFLMCVPVVACAADRSLNGAVLSPLWVVPFAGILLSIALVPVAAPAFWHHHFGKATAAWTLAFLLPFVLQFGPAVTAHEVLHTLLAEYLPFMILLFALFVVSGGIHIGGNLHGSAGRNTALLTAGTALASIMGTTGASMLLIRPLLRANDNRRYQAHVVVFFIFLVANIGGALTPLGDPPLFLGFLKGVDFFWTARAMFVPTLLSATLLLTAFYAIDRALWRREESHHLLRPDPTPDRKMHVDGALNAGLLAAVVATVLLTGVWKPGLEMKVLGTDLPLQSVARDVALLAIAALSLWLTPGRIRRANHFEFGPMVEVAMLFAGIFLTIIPAIAILRAGHEGVFAPLLALLSDSAGQPDNALYFWLTGALSSVLDNAPTYLVFFNLAGGDAEHLMGPLATTLTAISAGAVFMGANTYIGNAPNFMVKAIAESRGVRMPSFLGYLAWSTCALLPLYLLLSVLLF